jgi:uncharacterized surface protein with fasciclin (FAS1) repeats
MKFLASILAVTLASASAFVPITTSNKARVNSVALDASIVDTLRTLQGPGQVWGAEGIAVGKEESDFRGYDNFGKLSALLQSTGVAQALSGPGPFTIFAPTDSAIETYEANKGPVTGNVLAMSVVNGAVTSANLATSPLVTLSGATLQYKRQFRKDFVNDAIVGEKTFGAFDNFPTDVYCDNGVIHAVGIMLY